MVMFTTGMPISAYQIYDAGLARDHVLFNTQWSGRYVTPTSFMLLAGLGQFQPSDNAEIKMFKKTGIRTKWMVPTTTADWTPTATGTNMAGIVFDTVFGLTGCDATLRVGLGFIIEGYTNTLAGSGIAQQAQLTIVGGNAIVGWDCRVDYCSSAGATAFDFSSDMGNTSLSVVGSEAYVGQAPQGFSLTPETFSNWHQYFRVPFNWEHKAISQDNLFSNIEENTRAEAHAHLLAQINEMILASRQPARFGATDAFYTGTGDKRTRSGGLPYLIGYGTDVLSMDGNCWNTKRFVSQTSPDLAHVQPTAAEAQAFLDDMYVFGNRFPLDPRPYVGICSADFSEMIRRCVARSGINASYSAGSIKFPTLELPYQEIDLHNIKLRLINDQQMSNSDPHGMVRYSGAWTTALGGNGLTAAQNQVYAGNVMPVFVPTDLALSYANDKAPGGDGIRVPNYKPITAVRNPNMTEVEHFAELTVIIRDQLKAGVFHQRAALV
jgi:hypothetical protein